MGKLSFMFICDAIVKRKGQNIISMSEYNTTNKNLNTFF